jgi:cyclic beta-1,2-glucan synthetase
MATVQQYPLNLRLVLPPAERAPVKRDIASESRRVDVNAMLLSELSHWEPVTGGEPSEVLQTTWEAVSKRISDTAEQLRQVIATGKVLEGEARVFSDNLTLMRSSLTESHAGVKAARQLPRVRNMGYGPVVPRAFALATAYLESVLYAFDESDFAAFLATAQKRVPIRMTEVWSLRPFLELVLLVQISNLISRPIARSTCDFLSVADSAIRPAQQESGLSALVQSLRALADLEWKEFFERTAATERILREDPLGAYELMDFRSREAYRAVIAEFAEYSDCTERGIARAAIDLARAAKEANRSSGAARERTTHVGYYLMDRGQAALKTAIRYRPPVLRRIREGLLKWPDFFYLIGIELVTLAILALLVSWSHLRPLPLIAVALLALPAIECAVAAMNLIATRLFPPRRLPRLDFSNGIPDDCRTLVAVPILLTSEAQVSTAVQGLEIRYLANRDPNLHFALLTDLPDSPGEFDDKDRLAGFCAGLIDQLNKKYAHAKKGSFFQFHRNRAYNPSEGLWMGWERKRGKLLDLNRFLLHQSDQFPIKVGELSLLSNVRYVITLDLDTQLPADAAHRLVGTIAHPLNRPVVDRVTNTVVEGYGILQPRVDISIRSASRSRFAALLSGDTGVDFYARAVSDVYQDLFGEGIFTGKGIYEVEAFHRVLEHRFPCNAILSHDLIEGVYARTGLVSDIDVVDDYPSHFSAYSRRKHRWVRGDWQIIFGLFPRVRDYFGKMVRNPLSHVSRWKIFDNLRRSLMDLAIFLVFVGGWLWLPGNPAYWTLAALVMMFFPTYFQFLFTILTARRAILEVRFWKNLISDFASEHSRVFFRLTFLCHQTFVSVDAVVRTLIRVKFTHKRLLQWETAADAEVGTGVSLVDVYLRWSPIISVGIAALAFVIRPAALKPALPILLLWAASNSICKWLHQPQRPGEATIRQDDQKLIRNIALRTWRFFREYSTSEENWLVPDIVQETPPLIAHRVSTTNLGLLLNARLAALDFGFVTLGEFVRDTSRTLETVSRMPKFKGHLYNWYATDTLETIEPRFISTVDNGNLACSLWTLKQACMEAVKQPVFRPALWRGIHDIADLIVELTSPSASKALISAAQDLSQRVRELAGPGMSRFDVISALEIDVAIFLEKVSKHGGGAEVAWWAHELSLRVTNLKHLVEGFAPWLIAPFGHLEVLRRIGISGEPNFVQKLTLDSVSELSTGLGAKLAELADTPQGAEARLLSAALERSTRAAQGLQSQLASIAQSIQAFVQEMDFRFLYDAGKKQLSIGYDGNEGCVSKYHYDLLASEARAAVFVAIAKGDIPQDSWFELGRSYAPYKGEPVLRSWTGTAFEYLMPCLWMRTYPNTLLEYGAQAAIRAQRRFGVGKKIPWGISESACNQRNPDGHYRYHAFGVPGLAINRDDCSGDIVIAPYATFLALPFEAACAVKNLKRMLKFGWLSAYGFYESADFTPRRVSDGKTHEIIRSWMAHHQGMTLLAVANALCDSVMLRRFHAEPCVAAHERLLHERQPRVPPIERANEIPETAPKRLLSLMERAVQYPGLANLAPKTQ